MNLNTNSSANETLEYNPTLSFKTFAWTGFSTMVICCNGMAISIISHEWFGGDPQKRSLANRLTSNMFLALTLSTDTQVACLVLRGTNVIGDDIIIKMLQTDRAFFLASFAFMNLYRETC